MMPASVLLMLGEGDSGGGSGRASERGGEGKKEGEPYVNTADGSNIVNRASKQL